MPVFQKDNKSILFVHVPKAGGSYVEQLFKINGFSVAFFDNGRNLNPLRCCSPQHYHKEILEVLLKVDKMDYSFMTVREPISRFISEFKMRNNKRKNPLEINDWVKGVYSAYQKDSYIYDNHIRPQKEFYFQGVEFYKQDCGLDDKFAEAIEQKSGIELPVKKIDRVMVRDKIKKDGFDESVALSLESYKILLDMYAEDYELFGFARPSFACFDYNLK